jgi:putative glutamine amidotransferase
MGVRIAIPEPTSKDPLYNGRSLRPYIDALEAAGASPVVIPLKASQQKVAHLLGETQGILLPGSRYDVDPQTYGEDPIAECEAADSARTAADELLLQDGFNLYKPILAICYGVQALNVWRNGSLLQDIEVQLGTRVNHRPGRSVEKAHEVRIAPGTRLASMAGPRESGEPRDFGEPWVNSSHHQAIRMPGDNLVVSGVSPDDGVVEAVELDSPDHFVVGVQWHPERTYTTSPLSHAIFATFIEAAQAWEPRRIEESVVRG